MSPDPLGGDITNPQSLNRYAYAMNNPASLTDPLGLCQGVSGPCHPTYAPPSNDPFAAAGWTSLGLLDLGAASDSEATVTYEYELVPYPTGLYAVTLEFGDSIDAWDTTQYWQFDFVWVPTGVVINTPDGGTFSIPLGSFSIPASFTQTVQMFKNAGIAPSPIDNKYNPFHGTDFNLRDFSPVCSAHVTLDTSSGQSPGQATTGSMHFDAFNPTYNVPLYPLSPEGTQATFTLLHGAFDFLPWLLGIPGAGTLCQ
jgi:hypothetical protein